MWHLTPPNPPADIPSMIPLPPLSDQLPPRHSSHHDANLALPSPSPTHSPERLSSQTTLRSSQSHNTLSRPPPIHWRKKLVLVLVGLPARGKSYIAYKLVGYLRWRGLRAQLFNVGKARRHVATAPQDASFFSADNKSAQAARDAVAIEVLENLIDWLAEGGDVAVFDATNTTNKRRWEVYRHCQRRSTVLRVIFIESICDDEKVLESNYQSKVRNSPDYKDLPIEQALNDLRLRIANYKKVYETIDDDKLSYLKLINLNSKVICNHIHGQMGHLMAAYLMSIHIQPRPIYLVRTAKCEGEERIPLSQAVNIVGSQTEPFHMPFTISMAANLTQRGREFADRLEVFIAERSMEYFQTMRKGEHSDRTMNTVAATAAALGVGQPVESHADKDGGGEAKTDDALGKSTLSEPNSPAIKTDLLPLIIYSSTLPRALQTAAPLVNKALVFEQTSALNMMDTGVCHGLSIEEIRSKYPGELDKWAQQKYMYRFPGGESQMDKAKTLEPLVMELERHFFPVLIVSHASTLQVLYGYFLGTSRHPDSYYQLHIPQHHVIELVPHQYGWEEKRWDLRSDAEKQEDKVLRANKTIPNDNKNNNNDNDNTILSSFKSPSTLSSLDMNNAAEENITIAQHHGTTFYDNNEEETEMKAAENNTPK